MLLQRLVEYRSPDSDEDSVRPYSRTRTVRWRLDLTADGNKAASSTPNPSEKLTKPGQAIPVPNGGPHIWHCPLIGADDAQYVLGPCDAKSKPDRVTKAYKAFVELSRRWLREHPDDAAAQAVVAFYDQGGSALGLRGRRQVTFQLFWSSSPLTAPKSPTVTPSGPSGGRWLRRRKSGSGGRAGFCLVCGKRNSLLDRMPQALPKALRAAAPNRKSR